MNHRTSRFIRTLIFFACFVPMAWAAPARAQTEPGDPRRNEELEVLQSIARQLRDEASRPYDYLYFTSDFSARRHIVSSLSDPERTQFCGLTREQGQSLVREITLLDTEPLKFDKAVARRVGLSIGHKRFPRFRYLVLSRVVFDVTRRQAWLAADLNGESGALYRLDKSDGEWSLASRCAGWVRAVD